MKCIEWEKGEGMGWENTCSSFLESLWCALAVVLASYLVLGAVQSAVVCKKMHSIWPVRCWIFLNFSFAAEHDFPSLFLLVTENRRDKHRGNLFLFLLTGSATKYTAKSQQKNLTSTHPLQHSFHHFVEDKSFFSNIILFFLQILNICEVPKK